MTMSLSLKIQVRGFPVAERTRPWLDMLAGTNTPCVVRVLLSPMQLLALPVPPLALQAPLPP
jgi:hypothetical protein